MNDPALSAVLAFAALAVAIFSAATAWRTSRRQVALQERLLSLESARERDRRASLSQAQLRADILPAASNSYKLRIRNDGPGQARAVTVSVDGIPIEKSDRVSARGDLVTTLDAGAQAQYRVSAHLGMKLLFRVRLQWVDDTGPDREWESDLKI